MFLFSRRSIRKKNYPNSIQRIVENGQEIMVLDFSNCNEKEMMRIISKFREMVLAENNPCLVMGIFNEKSFITPRFMRHFESEKLEALSLMRRKAVVGMDEVKKMILKGYNTTFNQNIKAFTSREEAIRYLVSGS